MDLSPTLRAQLEGLTPYLDDPAVTEILVAGPDRVFVQRDGQPQQLTDVSLDERRIRSVVDRLARAFSRRPADNPREIYLGRVSPALRAVLIGGARGAACPQIRLIRAPEGGTSLADLEAAGRLLPAQREALAEVVRQRRSIVFAGPHGLRAGEWVTAVADLWMEIGRVAVIEPRGGPVAPGGRRHITLSPDLGVEGALAANADVIVVARPLPPTWTALMEAGRPFVAAMEAPDAQAALTRLVAWALAGASTLSRAAAESLVVATVDQLTMLVRATEGSTLGRRGTPVLRAGGLGFVPCDWPTAAPRAADGREEAEGDLGMAAPAFDEGDAGRALAVMPRPASSSMAHEPTRAGAWAEVEAQRFNPPTPVDPEAPGWPRAHEDPAEATRSADLPPVQLSDGDQLMTTSGLAAGERSPFADAVHAPSEHRATQAARVEEMVSGRVTLAAPPGSRSGGAPPDDAAASGEPEGFAGEHTPFEEMNPDPVPRVEPSPPTPDPLSRVRRSRRPDPRRRRDRGAP